MTEREAGAQKRLIGIMEMPGRGVRLSPTSRNRAILCSVPQSKRNTGTAR